MRRLPPSSAAFAVALALVGAVVAVRAPEPARVIEAASSTPWYVPTRPPVCTQSQRDTGNVAGCVITSGSERPEERGWPTPPFPDAVAGAELPWVDLARGATGFVVTSVQNALVADGADIDVDGQFGFQTETAVKAFQTKKSVAATGVVDKATADLLGVKNYEYTFPPPGWTWLGWGYNGSAALAQWEAGLASNTSAFGAVRVGSLRTPPEALPLFEGFLREIQARGYSIIGGTGTYVFRCTATTRKDCAGLGRDSLSNHAYGIATDFNTVQNPLKTYYGVDGKTACLTPMSTDIPQWVVQVAEKWGLYWGGYGWSSGCQYPTQWRTSVSRDPMHFEFNGTVEQALAIARYNGGVGACIDTADDAGVITSSCLKRGAALPAGTRLVVDTKAPTGATTAMMNVAAFAQSNGYVTAESCGPVVLPRKAANLSVRPGRVVSSLAVVPVDAQGRVCLFVSTTMHLIVDVQGHFAPAAAAPSGLRLWSLPPRVTLDTRGSMFCLSDGTCPTEGPVPAGAEVLSRTAVPFEAVAALANLSVTDASTRGYQTADACSTLVPGPQTRGNLTYLTGETVTNLALVPTEMLDGFAQFCTTSVADVQQMVEVQGFFVPAAAGGQAFSAVTPQRLLDTRQCWIDPLTKVERCNLVNAPGSVLRLAAPAGAAAVMVNVVAAGALSPGYIAVKGCSASSPIPTYPTVNAVVDAMSTSNLATVKVEADGTFCLYVSSSMHVVVDMFGFFSGASPLHLVPMTPTRVEDTRVPG